MAQNPQTTPQIEPATVPETDLEPPYRVIIHNDDITPMDFVIHILERIFFVDQQAALVIMYTAHFNGAAYVQTLPKSEAQARINRACPAQWESMNHVRSGRKQH